MKRILTVSKGELDVRVRVAKIEPLRRGNPIAPGRKKPRPL